MLKFLLRNPLYSGFFCDTNQKLISTCCRSGYTETERLELLTLLAVQLFLSSNNCSVCLLDLLCEELRTLKLVYGSGIKYFCTSISISFHLH